VARFWRGRLDDSKQDTIAPSKKERLIRLTIVLVVIFGLNIAGTWLGHLVNFQLFPRHEAMLHTIVMVAIVVYIFLMATPFMPGIEVGLAVMLLLGYKSALLIYLCTVIAVSISFIVGRIFPLHLVQSFLQWLYLEKASALVRQLELLNQRERLELLHRKAPAKFAPFLLKHRFLTIALLLNMPGNALIGGGGGIGLLVGMSRIIPFYKYFMIVAVAVFPVPLFVYLQGLLT